jgi:hypothetical protein
MWRWDQGRLAYFQFDALRQLSVFAMNHDFRAAERSQLESETDLPFAAGPNDPWRNYSRVLKLCLLVSQIGEVAYPTHVAQLLATPGLVTCDEYLHFLVRAFTDPSPALEGWKPRAHFRYPLLFSLRYILAKRAVLHEPVTTLMEIFGAYKQTGFIGDEPESAFVGAVGQHEEFAASGMNIAENCRQARESLKVISQIAYLDFQGSHHSEQAHIVLSLDAPDALLIFRGLHPVTGPRAADREAELRRLAEQFSLEADEGFTSYLDTAANDVLQSGFVEGNKVKKTHLVIERNNSIRQAYFATYPSPLCDVCSLNTSATYPWAKRVLDLHHLLPLSSGIQVKERSTTFDDLVPVCPSCHRAIHRFYDSWLSRKGMKDFPNELQAKAVYQDLKTEFHGAIHA